MDKNKILESIKQKIDKNSIFQPILFIWNNINSWLIIEFLTKELFSFYQVDKNSIYKLVDDSESIKIAQIREFIQKWNIKSSFKFQFFVVENIQRLTLESSNSLLKFLEEPWIWNIIFLTSPSTSLILETILSRVLVVDLDFEKVFEKNEFYYTLINDYLNKTNPNLIKYFFDDKSLQKQDYISLFENFIFYIKTNLIYIELLDQLSNSINLISNNNVIPKYEFDKLLISINNYEKSKK